VEKRGAGSGREVTVLSRTRNNLDPVWKEALTAYLPDFLELFLPEVHQAIDWTIAPIFLDGETRSLRRALPGQPAPRGQRRQVDLVAKVHLKGGQEALVLLHVEVQSQRDPHFELRMSLYRHRLFDRYGLPVFSLAVLGDADPEWRPCCYDTKFLGCRWYFRFATLKLLDWKERRAELEASTNPFALVVAAHLAVLETRPDQPARLALALRLVRLLLQRGFSQGETDGLYRLLEAMMTMSKTLAEAFDAEVARLEEEHAVKLITRSEMRGIKKGRLEGRLEGQRRMLQEVASARFGEAAGEIAEALESIRDPKVLLRLVGAVATATSAAEVLAAIRKETQGA